jgi:tetratricopeptide (TPR) repeat protein
VLAAAAEQDYMLMQLAEERHDLFISKPFALDILRQRLPPAIARRQVETAGRRQELNGQLRQARESYLLALNNNPYRLWPYFNLGRLLGRNFQFAPAQQCYRQIQKIDARALAAPLDLAHLQKLAGQEKAAQAQYSQLVSKHPWFLKPYDALAESFLAQGLFKQAAAIWERALHWGGSQHAPRLQKLAQIYWRQNQGEKAMPLLQKSAELRPWQDSGKKHNMLAEIYIQQGEWEMAASHARQGMERSLELRQADAALACLELLGAIQVKQGDPAVGLQTWNMAFDPMLWPHGVLPLAPQVIAGRLAKLARKEGVNSYARHYYNLAQSLAGKGQSPWLRQRETQLVELAGRGLELVQAGEFEQAEKCYRQGLSLDPTSARLCFNLAKLQYRQGKLESCRRYLQAAKRLGPDDEELMREIKNFAAPEV